VFCWSQNVISGTDKVRSHGTGKIAALRCFFVLKGTAFRCFILEAVPDVPLVRLWGSIGTRIPIWDINQFLNVGIFEPIFDY
jgi:hypothetical protein